MKVRSTAEARDWHFDQVEGGEFMQHLYDTFLVLEDAQAVKRMGVKTDYQSCKRPVD